MNASKLPKAIHMVVEALNTPSTATKLSRRITNWLVNEAKPSEVAQFYIDVANVSMAAFTLELYENQAKSERVMPVFLIGKETPAEWVAKHGTIEQKRALVERGELSEDVVIEAEIVEREQSEAKADA